MSHSRFDIALLVVFYAFCAAVLLFLVVPVLAIVPLSFSPGAFLTYPMTGFSLRWYDDFLSSPRWLPALRNSFIVGSAATLLATVLGTSAALGLERLGMTVQRLTNTIFLLPIVVPVVITGSSIYVLFAPLGLINSFPGLILAHTLVGAPFVVITVSATLQGFDQGLWRAALSLGATPATAVRRVILPMIMPGVISGAVFAFAASFDEIVITLLLAGPSQRTLPLQMFDGVREQISPTITAAATILVVMSVLLLTVVECLRRRGTRQNPFT